MPVNAPRNGANGDLLGLLDELANLGFEVTPFKGGIAVEEDGQPSLVGTDGGGVP